MKSRWGFASRPWLIVPVVAAMHITYAIAYLLNVKVGSITAMSIAAAMFGQYIWAFLFTVAILALFPMIWRLDSRWVHICLWPQQFMLLLMALSAVSAIGHGAYPDGYSAPRLFIFADQCYTFYLMLGHLAATVRNARFA